MPDKLRKKDKIGIINLRSSKILHIVVFDMDIRGEPVAMALQFSQIPKKADNASREMLNHFGDYFDDWLQSFRDAAAPINLQDIANFRAATGDFFETTAELAAWQFVDLRIRGQDLNTSMMLDLVNIVRRGESGLRKTA